MNAVWWLAECRLFSTQVYYGHSVALAVANYSLTNTATIQILIGGNTCANLVNSMPAL